MAFTNNRKSFKKSYQFLKYARAIYLRRGRYAPGRPRAFYMQALKLTLVFASLFFEAERNLETPVSSVFIDQGAGAFPRNRRTPYILMFLRTD